MPHRKQQKWSLLRPSLIRRWRRAYIIGSGVVALMYAIDPDWPLHLRRFLLTLWTILGRSIGYVLRWCLLFRGEDDAHQQPSPTAKKLRPLETTAGAPALTRTGP